MSKDETIDTEIISRFKIYGSKGKQEESAPNLYMVSHAEWVVDRKKVKI